MQVAVQSRANEIYQHLVAGDEAACRDYINRARTEDSASVLSVCEELTEAFHSIGDAWACSGISVYREHVASQIGQRLLMDLSTSLPEVPEQAPTAIGCTPELDPYSLPTLMIELVLRELGWKAKSLGSDLPLQLLDPAIEEMAPDICWVSISYVDSPERLRRQLTHLGERARERGVRILCGGQALTDNIRDSVEEVTFVDQLRDLKAVADLEA